VRAAVASLKGRPKLGGAEDRDRHERGLTAGESRERHGDLLAQPIVKAPQIELSQCQRDPKYETHSLQARMGQDDD
jgi:hypothetical protein